LEGFAEEGSHRMELSTGARLGRGGTAATAWYGVGETGFESEKQQCNGVVLEEVGVGQEDDRRRRLTVRPAADAIVVLWRHIVAA
jgi:hypothetical protein